MSSITINKKYKGNVAGENAISIAKKVLELEAIAINILADNLDISFVEAIQIMMDVTGRVIVCGMGKSGHVGRKFVATLASTGTPAQFVHPAEASHGDLGMITEMDCVVLISNSGETKELADVITHTRRFSIPLISITKYADSTLGKQSDVVLVLPDVTEACAIGMAPTTSTTVTLALTDALAVTLMEIKSFRKSDFLVFHPGGKLGAHLLKVSHVMHAANDIPLVGTDTLMSDALIEMSSKGFGVTGVSEDGELIGIITDGDLRRHMENLLHKTAGDVFSKNPVTIVSTALASEALGVMNRNKISSLFVLSDTSSPIGIVQIHDCLRAGVE